MAYLFVSVFINDAQADARHARADVDAQVAAIGGEWINDNAAVVPVPTDTALSDFLNALATINGAFNPAFGAVAVQVPSKQFSFVTDPLTNAAAVATIMGRKPVGA